MGHGSTCLGSGQGCSASVGEQIQYLNRAPGIADLVTEPVPVGSLLREQTGVLEAEWL